MKKYFLFPAIIFLLSSVVLRPAFCEDVKIDFKLLDSDEADNNLNEQLPLYAGVLALIKSKYIEDKKVKDLVYDSLRGMLERLDPYSEFLDALQYQKLLTQTDGEYGGIGLVISKRQERIVVVAPIQGAVASRAGIRSGDIILSVDGQDVEEQPLSLVVNQLRGKPGTKVRIKLLREEDDDAYEVELKRERVELVSVEEAQILEGNIAYFRILDFDSRAPKSFRDEWRKIRKQPLTGIILDLRDNPGGLLTSGAAVAEYFLKKKDLIVATKKRFEVQDFQIMARRKPVIDPKLPVVVLMNRGSASASEIVAAALRHHRGAKIVGENSFGKGSVQMVVPFPDGSAVRLTTDWYYTADEIKIEGKGVEPDVLVEPAELASDNTNSGDNYVEKAIEVISKE